MKKIINQQHNLETYLYAASRMFERASFYGLRSIFVLYLVSDFFQMDNGEALRFYTVFTSTIIASGLIGAILGDLLIGNKNAILIGTLLNAIGAFCLFIPSIAGLYIGLFLVVLGSGLYTPNLTSSFGRLYLNKTKLLDAGFTILYFAINIGAFLGVLVIGSIGELVGWNYGFAAAGVLMLLSFVPILFIEDRGFEQSEDKKIPSDKNVLDSNLVPSTFKQPIHKNAFLKVVASVVSVGLFWVFYEFGYGRIFDLQSKFIEQSTFDIPISLWSASASSLTIVIGLMAAIYWSYIYSRSFFKLLLGFLFGTISFGLLFLIPTVPLEQHITIYILSLLSLGIAEIYISPIMFSVLIKYANPRYLSILVSLSIILVRLLMYVSSIVKEFFTDLYLAAFLGMSFVVVLGVGFFLYLKRTTLSDEDHLKKILS